MSCLQAVAVRFGTAEPLKNEIRGGLVGQLEQAPLGICGDASPTPDAKHHHRPLTVLLLRILESLAYVAVETIHHQELPLQSHR